MKDYLTLEEEIEKQPRRRDKNKGRRMKVNGKSVFGLKQIITNKNTKTQKHENK
jgi:hypothetical protein